MRLVAAAILMVPGLAAASPPLELLGPVGAGGWNARIADPSAASTYFNPALLASAPDGFEGGFFVLRQGLSISAAPRPASSALTTAIYSAWMSDGMGGIRPLPSHPLASGDLAARNAASDGDGTASLASIGFVKHFVPDKLAFGFYAVLPTSHLQQQNAFYSDEREQYFSNSLHFELLGDRLTLSTFAGGLGWRPTPWLQVGVGVSAAIQTAAATPVYVPDGANYSVVLLDSEVSVSTDLSPHGGAVIQVSPRLALAVTMHASSSVQVSGRNHIKVSNTQSGDQVFKFVHGYDPLSVAGAAAWQLGDSLALVGTLLWRQWSSYEDRHGEAPLDAWNDTVSAAAGLRWMRPGRVVRLDATFVPSPVPDQAGRANYVDNTRLGASAGVEWRRDLGSTRLRGGLFVEAQLLFDRTATKRANAAHPVVDEFPDASVDPQIDPNRPLPEAAGLQTNNPGYPGYTSSGWLLGGGAQLAFEF